ncbi:MAG TPA: GTP-binding protein [Methylocella sp.]|nr:GTP-binding protein [Methylocella sp.]
MSICCQSTGVPHGRKNSRNRAHWLSRRGQDNASQSNSHGDIGIDNDLIVGADEEVFEMNNGCVCCTVRGDLIRIIEGLLKRRGKFDAILVETTGLADPAPVAQTFFVDADVRDAARLDAVVTVADAKWLGARLKDAPEAKNQIAFADVILLNKIDLVSTDEVNDIEARIRAINPYAKLHKTVNCALPLDAVLRRNAFDLERILDLEPEFLSDDDHHDHGDHEHEHHGHDHKEPHGLKHYHDEEMQTVALSVDKDIDPEKFIPWLQDYVQQEGASILRLKGILAFENEPRRFVFQGIHMLFEGDLQREWEQGEKRQSKLVFIGRNLPKDTLRQGFLACMV